MPAGAPPVPEGLWDFYPFRWRDELLAGHYRDRALVCFYPVMRAVSLRAAGRLDSALLELQRAWTMAPDALWLPSQLSFAARWLGFAASQKGDWGLAERAFRLALAAEPSLAETYEDLGTVCERTGRWEDAESSYMKAVGLDPRSGKAYYNLGALYWGRARWPEAAAAFSQAAKLDPGNAAAAAFAAQAGRRARTSR